MEKSISSDCFVRSDGVLELGGTEIGKSDLPRGSETILVVEHEEALLGLLDASLRDEGYRVITASDGHEAVESCLRLGASVDLVLTDAGLPVLSGKDLVARLKEINPATPIVLWGSYVDPRLRTELLRAGANAFMAKPFGLREILMAVRSVLDSAQ